MRKQTSHLTHALHTHPLWQPSRVTHNLHTKRMNAMTHCAPGQPNRGLIAFIALIATSFIAIPTPPHAAEDDKSMQISIASLIHSYPQVLMTVGTLAGRHRYFAQMSAKIFKRFLPGGVKPKIKCPKPKNSTTKKE